MARVFITGSSDGLGRMAAQLLIEQGHAAVLHARNQKRADAIAGRCSRCRSRRDRRPCQHRANEKRRRAGQCTRRLRCSHSQRRHRIPGAAPHRHRGRPPACLRRQHARPLHPDRPHSPPEAPHLPQLRLAPKQRRQLERSSMGGAPLARHAGLLRLETPRRDAGLRGGAPLVRCSRTEPSRAGSRPRWAAPTLPMISIWLTARKSARSQRRSGCESVGRILLSHEIAQAQPRGSRPTAAREAVAGMPRGVGSGNALNDACTRDLISSIL